jgi:hypothetical protein
MSIDGTWNVTMNTPMGAQSATLTLKSNGNALEGSMAGPQGTVDIEDGKVDGDTATWGITAPQMGMKIEFTGAVNGDKISGEAELGSFGKATFEGTRA